MRVILERALLTTSVAKKVIDYIDKARNNDSGVSGIPSGFSDLDKVTGGWQRSDMIVLAARPGKSDSFRTDYVEMLLWMRIFHVQFSH